MQRTPRTNDANAGAGAQPIGELAGELIVRLASGSLGRYAGIYHLRQASRSWALVLRPGAGVEPLLLRPTELVTVMPTERTESRFVPTGGVVWVPGTGDCALVCLDRSSGTRHLRLVGHEPGSDCAPLPQYVDLDTTKTARELLEIYASWRRGLQTAAAGG